MNRLSDIKFFIYQCFIEVTNNLLIIDFVNKKDINTAFFNVKNRCKTFDKF